MKLTKNTLKQLIREEIDRPGSGVSLAAWLEGEAVDLRNAIRVLQAGDIKGALRALERVQDELGIIAEHVDELEARK